MTAHELARASTEELAECGWRYEEVPQPDGTMKYVMVPLTEEEYLHPKEGYHMPNNTFHADTISDARDMLARRYANQPTVGVFTDLLIIWDIPDLGDHSPDVCVIFGVKDKDRDRPHFKVAEEGVRPSLMIEVVSGRYRKADRETKVEEYESAGVQEYVIIDRRRRRGQTSYEVLGYRLVRGRFRPISPDEQDRILCRMVGLWLSMSEGRVVMEDAESGERLLTSRELEARVREEQTAREAAEARAREEQKAREVAEAEVARLRAELERLRGAT